MPASGKRSRADDSPADVQSSPRMVEISIVDDATLLASAGCEKLDSGWQRALLPVLRSREWAALSAFVAAARSRGIVYPPASDTWTALAACPLSAVKVVILGQDPYHGAGQAHGLAFSVPPGVAIPPSLRNILKEVADDVGAPPSASAAAANGSLAGWAKQGVLLLNTVLTVDAGAASSHAGRGWEAVTSALVAAVIARDAPCALLLWGKPAQAVVAGLGMSLGQCRVFQAPHPSPLSSYRGFFGCKHFSKASDYLAGAGVEPIRWHDRL